MMTWNHNRSGGLENLQRNLWQFRSFIVLLYFTTRTIQHDSACHLIHIQLSSYSAHLHLPSGFINRDSAKSWLMLHKACSPSAAHTWPSCKTCSVCQQRFTIFSPSSKAYGDRYSSFCLCFAQKCELQHWQRRMTHGRPIDLSCLFSLLRREHWYLLFSSTYTHVFSYE